MVASAHGDVTPTGSCPRPAASLTIFWAPGIESCIAHLSVLLQGSKNLVEDAKVKEMLLEKITTPRVASLHLPGLHPWAFICLFFPLCEQSLLPGLSSSFPGHGAEPEAAEVAWGGRWSPSLPARAAVAALGLLAVFLQPPAHRRQPREAQGEGKRGLGRGKPFPAAEQPSAAEPHRRTDTAI